MVSSDSLFVTVEPLLMFQLSTVGLWASVAVYLRLVIERCQKCCLPAAVQPFHGTVCLSLYCFHAVS